MTKKKPEKRPAQFNLRGKLFYEYRVAIAERDTARSGLKHDELAARVEAEKEVHAPLVQKQNAVFSAVHNLRRTEQQLTLLQQQIAKKFKIQVKDLEKYAINEYSGQMTFVPLKE